MRYCTGGHGLLMRVLATGSVGVTVGSGRGQLGWGLDVARARPCTLLAVRPSWLVYSLGATLLAGRGSEKSQAGVVRAGSPLLASALPPAAWPIPTAPLDGMVCDPP